MPGNNPKNNMGKRCRGYTLIEIIVVMALFSVLVLIITDVFLMALKSQQQTVKRQEVSSAVRSLAETIARQVRVSEIEYDSYPPEFHGGTNDLYLRDQAGHLIHYSYDDNSGNGRILVDVDGGSAYELTDPNAMRVIALKFFISPDRDPFTVETCVGTTAIINGCFTSYCTVREGPAKVGYCGCKADTDCASGYCDTSLFYNNMFNQFCCDTPPCGEARAGICLPQNIQPRVTFVIGLQSRAAKAEEIKNIYLQTTVSSRVYKR